MSGTYAIYPPEGGSSGGSIVAAGTASIGSGASSITVTYDVTLTTATPPVFAFFNTTDSSPIFLQGIITAYSTTQFTCLFNAPTDTANYSIVYSVSEAV